MNDLIEIIVSAYKNFNFHKQNNTLMQTIQTAIPGEQLIVVNAKPLKGNDVAPPLKEGDVVTLKEVIFDSKMNPHFDVGLESKYSFVRSFETKENLPKGDQIHWCHPSRFQFANK